MKRPGSTLPLDFLCEFKNMFLISDNLELCFLLNTAGQKSQIIIVVSLKKKKKLIRSSEYWRKKFLGFCF